MRRKLRKAGVKKGTSWGATRKTTVDRGADLKDFSFMGRSFKEIFG